MSFNRLLWAFLAFCTRAVLSKPPSYPNKPHRPQETVGLLLLLLCAIVLLPSRAFSLGLMALYATPMLRQKINA
jgi:hypothetical protein